jgi:hypothetical protein
MTESPERRKTIQNENQNKEIGTKPEKANFS